MYALLLNFKIRQRAIPGSTSYRSIQLDLLTVDSTHLPKSAVYCYARGLVINYEGSGGGGWLHNRKIMGSTLFALPLKRV